MKAATLIPFILSLTGAMPTLDTASDSGKRQVAEIIEVVLFEALKLGTNSFLPGPEQPACADGSEKQGDYSLRAYKTVDGKNITVADMCWTSGGYQPNLGDMMAAQCLLGLHQNQKTTCIDLAGSPCDGFAGSAIGNVEVYSGFSGDPNQQPDKNSVDRMNAAFGTVQGLPHGWDIGSIISIAPINDDGTETGWTALIRGTGANDC